MDPRKLQGNLRLVEINNRDHSITLFKPTTKDSGHKPFFRYNPCDASWGQTLNLNTGESSDGFQEFVMKDFDLQKDPLRTCVAWQDVG